MKLLLLPLRAALALPTTVSAGNLKSADLWPEEIKKVISQIDRFSKDINQLKINSLSNVYSGKEIYIKDKYLKKQGLEKDPSIDQAQFNSKPFVISFEKDKLKVDNSAGITAKRIVHFSFVPFNEYRKVYSQVRSN